MNKLDWDQFYVNRINSTYQIYFENRYKVFLDAIIKSHPKSIMEGGCGIGSISKYFTRYGVACNGFDNDDNMIKLAKANCPDGYFFNADLLESEGSKSIFLVTHGVLEHMTNEQIEHVLRKYPNSIHYVPTDGYDKPSFGDERLLSTNYWYENFKIKEVTMFNDDKDLYFKSNY